MLSATRKMEELPKSIPKKTKSPMRREIVEASLKSGIGAMATGLVIEGTGIISGKILPPDIALDYMVNLRLIIMLSAFAFLPFQVAIPSLIAQYSRGEKQAVSKRVEKLKLVVFSTLLVGAAMVPFINWALSYVSKNPALHFNINLWLTLVLYGASRGPAQLMCRLRPLTRSSIGIRLMAPLDLL